MVNNIEQPNSPEHDVLSGKRVQEFLEIRNIKEEDLSLIKETIQLSERYEFAHYHNFFTFNKENSSNDLDFRKNRLDEMLTEEGSNEGKTEEFEAELEFIDKFKQLLDKYDYRTAHHLLRLCESKSYLE